MIYRVQVVLTLLLADFTSASNYSGSHQVTDDFDYKLMYHTASCQNTETGSLKWTVTMRHEQVPQNSSTGTAASFYIIGSTRKKPGYSCSWEAQKLQRGSSVGCPATLLIDM